MNHSDVGKNDEIIKPHVYINHSHIGKIIKQFKHVLVNHSDVSSRICLETTHRVHNDALAGM